MHSALGSLLVPTEASLSVSFALVITESYVTGYILVYTTRDHGVKLFGLILEFLPYTYHKPKKQNKNPQLK